MKGNTYFWSISWHKAFLFDVMSGKKGVFLVDMLLITLFVGTVSRICDRIIC